MNFWVRVRVRVSQHFFRWFAMFFSIFMRALHGITFIRHIFTYIIFYLYLWVLCPWVCLCSSQSPRDSISENKAHIVPTLNGISFCSFSLRIRFRFYSILCVMEYQICIKISIEFFLVRPFYLSIYRKEFPSHFLFLCLDEEEEMPHISLFYCEMLMCFTHLRLMLLLFQCQSHLNGLPIAFMNTRTETLILHSIESGNIF